MDTVYHQIAKEVALGLGATTLDLGQVLSDGALFFDECHPTARGHELIGLVLARHVRAVLEPAGRGQRREVRFSPPLVRGRLVGLDGCLMR